MIKSLYIVLLRVKYRDSLLIIIHCVRNVFTDCFSVDVFYSNELQSQKRHKPDQLKVILLLHHDGSFNCVEVLPPSQPYGIMSSTVNLPNHTFTGQA